MRNRPYPLRLSREKWRIPVQTYHRCDESCSFIIEAEPDNASSFRLIKNPNYIDGKCEKYNTIENTGIRLDNFSMENPTGVNGVLCNPDEIVIPYNNVSMCITFPVSIPIYLTFRFEHSEITRKEILHAIYSMYRHIYSEEEKTASPQTYEIVEHCIYCVGKDSTESLKPATNTEHDCSICLDELDSGECVSLPCNHSYHSSCITEWLKNNRKCPMCRGSVVTCDNCGGEGSISSEHSSVIIPREHRETAYRNITDGIFGIYGYDLDDLIITELSYDKNKNFLDITIT